MVRLTDRNNHCIGQQPANISREDWRKSARYEYLRLEPTTVSNGDKEKRVKVKQSTKKNKKENTYKQILTRSKIETLA